MKPQPKVVICGSFRRDAAGLRKLFLELETNGLRILAPLDLDFEEPGADYVRLRSELDFNVNELERYYLRAIEESDFVWLHAPGGYVGVSGAFELGYAYRSRKKIYCKNLPADPMLQNFVDVQTSVFDVIWDTPAR